MYRYIKSSIDPTKIPEPWNEFYRLADSNDYRSAGIDPEDEYPSDMVEILKDEGFEYVCELVAKDEYYEELDDCGSSWALLAKNISTGKLDVYMIIDGKVCSPDFIPDYVYHNE